MRVNVDKVLERDQKLSELDDRADALQAGASQFETSAAKLKRKYWWKNLKVNVEEGVTTPKLVMVFLELLKCLLLPDPTHHFSGLCQIGNLVTRPRRGLAQSLCSNLKLTPENNAALKSQPDCVELLLQ